MLQLVSHQLSDSPLSLLVYTCKQEIPKILVGPFWKCPVDWVNLRKKRGDKSRAWANDPLRVI